MAGTKSTRTLKLAKNAAGMGCPWPLPRRKKQQGSRQRPCNAREKQNRANIALFSLGLSYIEVVQFSLLPIADSQSNHCQSFRAAPTNTTMPIHP